MEKSDWLLLMVEDSDISPVQIQKTMFLFGQETRVPESETYEFVPYNWGPCSFEVYNDIDDFLENGMVHAIPTRMGWNRYCLSNSGRAKAKQLRHRADPDILRELYAKREWVMERPFRTLLRDVYQKYPKFAVASHYQA